MKNSNYSLYFLLVLFVFAILSSCSKGKEEADPIRSAGMSMKVDGVEWNAVMTTLFTEEHETSKSGKYYQVYLSGSRIIDKNSDTEDDLAETMGLYINIPASKFKNPTGTYPIILKDSEMGHAWGVFGSSTDIRDATTYLSGNPESPEKTVGSLQITGFETGATKVLGQATGSEGYTKLSGTFKLDVFPMTGTGSALKITQGEFDLTDAINIGW